MAAYDNLRAVIAANIYQNNNNEVTADMVKAAMNAMVASLGAEFQFGGVAEPDDNPGTPDYKVAYLAATPGVYSNFGGIVVADGEVVNIKWDGSAWSKEVTGIASVGQISADIPRAAFVKRNTTISYDLHAVPPYVRYAPSNSVDAVLVAIPDGATRIVPTGGVASRFRFFDTYGKVDAESYIDAQDITTGAIPAGAKFAVVLFPHADNPGGLDNLLLTIEPTAEQVAEGLENVVGGRDVPLDLSAADELGFIIQQNGTWGSTAGKLSSGFAIPIPKFATGITITGSANGNSVVALLANNTADAGETPNYAANHQGRIVISGGETIRRNLESDCKYLYFAGTTNAGADIKPTVSCSYAIPGAKRPAIRILFIGSSGEQDIVGYVPPVLSGVLPDYDIIVGDMYTSGSQADDYVAYYKADTPCEKFNYWTPSAPYWSRLDNMTIEDVLALQEWDLVVFKGDVADCRQLMRIIQSVATYPVSFVTDARYSRNYDGDWAAVMAEVDGMMRGAGFAGWFPCGTALENARSNSLLRVAGTNTLTERTEFTIPAGRSLAFYHRIRQITGHPSTITAQRISGDGTIDIYASAAIMGTDSLLLSLTDGSEHAATFAGGTDYVRITNNGSQAAVVSLEDSNSLGNFFLYQDNQHLQSGLGTLLVGYAVALRVLEWTGNKHRGLNGSRFAPTDAVLATILPQGGALGHGPSCGIVDYVGSDGNTYDRAQLVNIGGTLYVYTSVFDNTPDAGSITATAGQINWRNIFAAQEIAQMAANYPDELTDCSAYAIDTPQKD